MVKFRRLEEYRKIFGLRKIRRLWLRFLRVSESSWLILSQTPPEFPPDLRLIFHSWKSSSLIFGMDEFSRRCSRIEDNLLCRRHQKAFLREVDKLRACYQNSTQQINDYFQKNTGDDSHD